MNQKMRKFLCTKCKKDTNISDINFVTVAKENGYDYFNLCNACYKKIIETLK